MATLTETPQKCCGLCKTVLTRTCSYTSATKPENQVLAHIVGVIGQDLQDIGYICAKCNRLLSKVLKTEQRFKSRFMPLQQFCKDPPMLALQWSGVNERSPDLGTKLLSMVGKRPINMIKLCL